MRSIFWLSVLILIEAEEAEFPPCKNEVIYLNESWSSWHLLPPGKFKSDSPCTFTLVYPNDTALCGKFFAEDQFMSWGIDKPIGGVDAFGTVVNLIDYRVMVCMPPPWYSIFVPNKTNSYIDLPTMNSCNSKNCTKYHLMKVNAFINNKTIEIIPGMRPYIIVGSNGTGQQITYNFTGNMAAVYVKMSNAYFTYEKTPLGAESFFLYNGNGQITGTPASWQSSLQRFSQLIVHEMPPGIILEWAESPGLLIVMAREDVDGLIHPKFVQPTYHIVPTVDASQGETSVTIVDGDSYNSSCVQYQLGWFTFSDDIEIIVHNGFPKQNITEDLIVLRLDATALAPDYVMILGCTKTLRILKGSLSFHIDRATNYGLRNHTIKGFIKTEPASIPSMPNNANLTQLTLFCYGNKDCNMTGEITFQGENPDSKVELTKYGKTFGQETRQPNETTFEANDLRFLTIGLNKGTIHFEITETDPE